MSLPERLASGPKEEPAGGGGGLLPTGLASGHGGSGNKEGEPPDPSSGLMQRIVIIQRDEKGYGFTVSGDNPVFVASVKPDGAASRAGVQQGDRILKVNGTLVTNRNHLDVVKLIKSGSYVALALLGKRTERTPSSSGGSPASGLSSGSPAASTAPNIASNRDSVGGRVTAPQPVDPDKDRELQQQKINMTRSMYETAKEDFEKLQRLYVAKPSDKLHTQLLEKERTVKTLENQFKQLTGAGDDTSSSGNSSRPGSNRFSDSEHAGLESSMQSWASSLPTTASDLGSMSDSPQTSPSVSPTPNDPQHQRHNGQEMEDSVMGSSTQDIITIDDEDIHSEDDQANDPGPFADIKMLESRPAHMAIVLNYLISNSEPAPVLFHIISDSFSRISASTKELRKWAYEIYSTFIAQMAPLSIGVDDSIINQIDNILITSASRTDNESTLRNMFLSARQSVQQEIGELLADFRNKRDLGMANFYGFQKIHDNMDRSTEIKVSEELLIPILEAVSSEDNNRNVRDRDQAIGWALATFLRQVAGSKSAHSSTLDRVQTFMMKDKRSIKFPGYKSSRAKSHKGHQFTLTHFYVTTFCNQCNTLIWGVGYQGYQCQSCEMTLHKQCVEEITETCCGKQKRRVSKLIPVMQSNRRISSNTGPNQSALSQLYQQQMGGIKLVGDAPDNASMTTQPYPTDQEGDLAGLPPGHSVKSIINRYQELSSPTGAMPGLEVPGMQGKESGVLPGQAGGAQDRKGGDLNRSGSLNNKGEKSDRPPRRAKSDVDVDPDTFKAINQSGSSSASSLSNRSVESPSQSVEGVNSNHEALRALHEADSDLELDPELPSLQSVLGDDVLRKLKPKEKKRQDVINELFYTERNHLRNLKVLDLLFNRPMQQERGVKVMFELALALFPNMEEMIALHETLVKDIKVRSKTIPVKEVGDLLLKRFDGEAGEKFRKGCAEYCRNQAFALEALKKQTRKEPKLAQFLIDAESNQMCRRLQLKDLVPSQMQRLTKYPLLIDSLMKHTQSHSDEYKHLEQAHEKCKHILAYVNQAVKECENYHKIRDIQRKLDTKSIEGNTEDMLEIKNLDLSQHKLIFDGPLTWKLRGHRTVDLHLLLFEDMLVLLQKQDDKYVLKFQSTNAQITRDEPKYSHGPVLRLKNVLARNLATDKKSFFVVNMTDVGAQMYEFTAATSELRIKWCKLINDKVDEVKRQGGGGVVRGPGGPAMRSQSLNQAPQSEKTVIERSKTTRISRKNHSVRNPNVGSPSDSPPLSPPPKVAATEDHVDGLRRTIGDVDDDKDEVSELIQPEEVRVDSAVVVEAQAVRSPLATQSQGSASDAESQSSSSAASGNTTTAAPVSQQQQQQQQPLSPSGRGAAATMPREQLKNMAVEMNTILAKLMGAMNVGAEERHRLRQELAEAQERLSALKELQRQMTESGVVPPDRIILENDDADIPRATVASSSPAARAADSSAPPQSSAETSSPEKQGQAEAAEQQENSAETIDQCSSSPPLTSPSEPLLEASIEPVAAAAPPSDSQLEQQEQQQAQQGSEEMEQGLVHHGIQEMTHLEESVEALSSTPPTKVDGTVEVSMEKNVCGEDEEDDDDDNNEVSVKDLPLPDVNLDLPVVRTEEEEDRMVASSSSQPPSSLLDAVDLDDSDSDTEGGPSLVGGHLATTLEDPVGEEEEEEEEEGDELNGEEEEALLRKLNASSLLSSSLLSSALASPSSVDTEIITVPGEEGNNNKDDSGSSNVDDPAGDGRPGSSSVDADTILPIEI